jgi:NLI interacting factor-like phosphatase
MDVFDVSPLVYKIRVYLIHFYSFSPNQYGQNYFRRHCQHHIRSHIRYYYLLMIFWLHQLGMLVKVLHDLALLILTPSQRQRGWRTAKRPGVDYFIAYLSQFYEVVIFTSQYHYVRSLMPGILNYV